MQQRTPKASTLEQVKKRGFKSRDSRYAERKNDAQQGAVFYMSTRVSKPAAISYLFPVFVQIKVRFGHSKFRAFQNPFVVGSATVTHENAIVFVGL